MTNFKTTINRTAVVCDGLLADFEILKKASSNVDYFAIRRETSQLFIQFSNGKCFVYEAVPTEVLEGAKDAESIGRFYHANIKGKYAEAEVGNRLVVVDLEDDEDDVFAEI
jgi:hypothetical protein